MEQSKPDDKENRGQTGPSRVYLGDEGEITDFRSVTGHAYKVVYAQKSVWMLYMRLDKSDGKSDRFLRIVFGTCDCGCGRRTADVSSWGGGVGLYF